MEVVASGQLVINKVQDTDAGRYKCVASNDAGQDAAFLDLDVGCRWLQKSFFSLFMKSKMIFHLWRYADLINGHISQI